MQAIDYFGDMGLDCPLRVNPPDYFMDVIAGLVSEEFIAANPEYEDQWLFHNWEKRTPAEEVKEEWFELISQAKECPSPAEGDLEMAPSSSSYVLKAVAVAEEFPPPRTPQKFVGLVWLFLSRSGTQMLRHKRYIVLDNALPLFAAICLGKYAVPNVCVSVMPYFLSR
jgi:hypothetical protein